MTPISQKRLVGKLVVMVVTMRLLVISILIFVVIMYFSGVVSAEENLSGVDNDRNGVWDYIDRYIDTTYPGDAYIRVRSACRQFSRAIQGAL